MLYLIGLGLCNGQDISLRGLEKVKSCDYIYLENYTSKLDCDLSELEKLYGKKVILAEREFVEDGQVILDQSVENNVALLIIGDVFGATTHISLFKEAKQMGIDVEIVNNASILNAVGVVGLELYKYGKVASIPFGHADVKVPIDVLKMNQANGLHSLFLLDLVPKENKYMECKEAVDYLISNSAITADTKVVVCAKLGCKDYLVKYLRAGDVKDLMLYPQCLIVPGELHFVEEEMLELWK
tara:strand:+ start:1804 stop:2526 length:723 start_codon:yes stop_codon:yes gene_type:complete